MNNIAIQSLRPGLPTKSLARTIEFYTDLIGFTSCVLCPEENAAFCILHRNGVQIAFQQDDESANESE